jgi:hypothetical protein
MVKVDIIEQIAALKWEKVPKPKMEDVKNLSSNLVQCTPSMNGRTNMRWRREP